MLRRLGRVLMRILGWQLEGEPPALDKYVLLAAPHTSNWDGVFMVIMNYASHLECRWMVKDKAYRFPFRRILDLFGAVPVDRSKSSDLVGQIAEHFEANETFHLLLAPEGTRSLREFWKSGFYHIARRANVPIVLTYLDYSRNVGGFGPVIHLTGDVDADMAKISAFYQRSWAKFPEKFTAPVLQQQLEALQDAAQ